MHCIYYLFCKCRKKEKKEKEINKLQKLLLEKNLKNVKSYGSTIKNALIRFRCIQVVVLYLKIMNMKKMK